MAQPIASAAAGRVNRRFLLLAFILATLSGVLLYAAWPSGGSESSTSAVDVPVLVAKAAIPAGTVIAATMVTLVDIPENAVGDQALRSVDAVVGRTARYPIAANEQILASKVVAGTDTISNDVLANILDGGERGMAIDVEAVVGAGGLVLPGDHVDVYWVPDSPNNDVPGAQLLADNVEVVAVSQTIVEIPATAPGLQNLNPNATPADTTTGQGTNDRVRGADAAPDPKAITVTLMLSPEEASRVFCGDEAGTLRLAVRAFGDNSPNGLPVVQCVILGQNNP